MRLILRVPSVLAFQAPFSAHAQDTPPLPLDAATIDTIAARVSAAELGQISARAQGLTDRHPQLITLGRTIKALQELAEDQPNADSARIAIRRKVAYQLQQALVSVIIDLRVARAVHPEPGAQPDPVKRNMVALLQERIGQLRSAR
jgi:hypothetical protein